MCDLSHVLRGRHQQLRLAETRRVSCSDFRDSAALAVSGAKSGSCSGPSEPSIHVVSMVVSLVGAALGMVLVAATASGLHAEFAGDAGRCNGELQWAVAACVSTA